MHIRHVNVLRRLVMLVSTASIGLFLIGIPEAYRNIRDECIDQACKALYNPPPGSLWLAEHGLTASQYALAYVGLYTLEGTVFITAGAIVYAKSNRDLMSLLGTFMLVVLGVTFTPILDGLRESHWLMDAALRIHTALGFVAFLLFFFLFPTGRFSPAWTVYLLAGIVTAGLPHYLFPQTAVDLQWRSQGWFAGWVVLWMASVISLQVYRYCTELKPVERQQTKWAVYGVTLGVFGLLAFTVMYLAQQAAFDANPLLLYLLEIGIQGSILLIPVTLSIAVLRTRLWDIDPLVNRTLVYGLLTIGVIAIYTVSVWYVGTAFRTGSWWTSLIATSIVAVSFAPLKVRLQRSVNQLMYGDTGDPYSVLWRLGQSLAEPLSSEAALKVIVATVRAALRLPYAAIVLYREGELAVVMEEGDVQEGTPYREALIHRGELLGYLYAAPRSAGEAFTASDHKLLGMLARQAGVVVENLRVTLDLRLTAAALQESREKLVMAREEERKRLRRDLHDDLAPRLAAIALTASAAEDLVEKDAQAAQAILSELRSVIRSTVTDIREMVHHMRPPALDELGLIGALRERVQEIKRSASEMEIVLSVPAELPQLPAALEVAAYRIATEAMVNALRHAAAQHCIVKLSVASVERDEAKPAGSFGLWVEVSDNGEGLRSRSEERGLEGIGLSSMKERAEEVGGSFFLDAQSPQGTVIRAYLPISFGGKEGSV
ncbi:sensor histidine kinase [Paenibacillus silviterrae]|uniref:sensor histidine kinase n=1 Tax=Paenibacillus silviterrae TaxID=3242194 RepID=UPI0025435BCA|nr:sensor histidine kinase [Paenibacillus chinjuensis]